MLQNLDGIDLNVRRPNSSATPPGQISPDGREACAQLVRDVLASRTFAKSARLSELLSYICRVTLDGKSAQLNEQQIGIQVFGRSPSYNAADDSFVRSQARLLRQKLEEYFEHESPHTFEVITVPKGGYVPVFRPRELTKAAETLQPSEVRIPASAADELPASLLPAAPTEASLAGRDRSHRLRWPLLLGVGLLFVLVTWTITQRTRTGTPSASDLLWHGIFQKDQPTLIVPSDDGLVLFQELTHTSVALSDYLDGSYLRRVTASSVGGLTFDPQWFASHQYTSSADLNLTLRLSQVPQAASAKVEARNARGLRLDDLKTRNVILIGGPGSNPWVALFADRLNFQLGWDWTSGEGFVRNNHPEQKEVAIYRDVLVGSTRKSYGLLAYLPGIDGNKQALLVEGTGMAGTEAAAGFPFGPAFSSFAHSIGATRETLPDFELLLETSSIGGNAPEAHIIAYRVLHP